MSAGRPEIRVSVSYGSSYSVEAVLDKVARLALEDRGSDVLKEKINLPGFKDGLRMVYTFDGNLFTVIRMRIVAQGAGATHGPNGRGARLSVCWGDGC